VSAWFVRGLRGIVGGAALASSAVSFAGAAGEPSARLFVLDGKAGALHAVDSATGQIEKTTALSGQPRLLLATPDGSRVLVLDSGSKEDDGAPGRSSVTIVGTDRMEIVGRVELGWGMSVDPGPLISSDGHRLAVLCPGYRGRKTAESLPTEAVVVDVVAAKVAGRVPLDQPPLTWVAGTKGHIHALLPRQGSKKTPGVPASVVTIDLETAAAAHLPLDGDVTDLLPSPDGRLLYLLDHGRPSGNPTKNVNGQLHVVSTEPLARLRVLDAGSGPRGLYWEETSQQLFVLTEATPVKGTDRKGQLLVVRGETLDKTVPIAPKPLFLRRAPGGREIMAVGVEGLSVLSVPGLAPVREVHIDGPGINWTSDVPSGPPNELAMTPDAQRGFVTYENSSKLLTLDLATGQKVASATTGRKGAKLLQMAAATALTASSYYSSRDVARHTGQRSFYYYRFGIRETNTSLIPRHDGRFVYVVNSLTNDVTVVDAVTGAVVENLGARGRELASLPTGRFVAAVSDSELHLLDTTNNTVAGHWELPGLLGLATAPSGREVVAVSEKGVLILDPAKGTVTARNDSFKGNTDRLFVERRPQPGAAR
jgi:DNA-binding beta-propeller fold protein YncE